MTIPSRIQRPRICVMCKWENSESMREKYMEKNPNKQTNDSANINTAPKNMCHVQPRKTANSESMRGKCMKKNKNIKKPRQYHHEYSTHEYVSCASEKTAKACGENTWKKPQTNKQTTAQTSIQHPRISVMCNREKQLTAKACGENTWENPNQTNKRQYHHQYNTHEYVSCATEKTAKACGKNTWKNIQSNKQTTILSWIQHPWICVMCNGENSESMREKYMEKTQNKQTNDNTIINTAPKNMCHV